MGLRFFTSLRFVQNDSGWSGLARLIKDSFDTAQDKH
jgi:hypothetical protein